MTHLVARMTHWVAIMTQSLPYDTESQVRIIHRVAGMTHWVARMTYKSRKYGTEQHVRYIESHVWYVVALMHRSQTYVCQVCVTIMWTLHLFAEKSIVYKVSPKSQQGSRAWLRLVRSTLTACLANMASWDNAPPALASTLRMFRLLSLIWTER